MSESNSKQAESFSAYDLFLFGLAVLSLINLLILILIPLDSAARSIFIFFDRLIALVFLFDFLRNLYLTPSRREYMKWGWLDFLSGIPFIGFAIFRLARAIRILRAVRKMGVGEIFRSIRRKLAQHVFITAVLLMAIMVVFGGMLVERVERVSPNSSIETPGEAIWWAIVTIMTVGYGDAVPVTPSGRIVAVIMMFLGVGLAGVLTALIAKVFIDAGQDEEVATKADIESLRAEIVALKDQIRRDE